MNAQTDEMKSSCVGLVSCMKKKASAHAPAKDLYKSLDFRKMRAHVEASCDEW